MRKEKIEVKSYKVKAICECGGEMKPNGMTLASNPPLYPHRCENCGITENLRATYPRIEYDK